MAPRGGQLAAAELASLALARFPGEAARAIETAKVDETVELLERQPAEQAAGVLRRLTPDRAARLVAAFEQATRRRVLENLDPGRAASLVSRLDEEEREACLTPLDPALARELRELAEYPRDTAGGLMDPRITTFRPDASVRDVIRRLRTFRRRRVQDVFVVDTDDHLQGRVSMQEVVMAPPGTLLEAIMRPVPSVPATASREDVISQLERYRMGSLPVVDFDGRVLGVLREDELLAVAREEAASDAVAMVGAGRDERALSPAHFAIRKRLPWLQVNLLTAFLAASVVGLFESTIATFTALAVLLPVVAGQSGNTGAQALAVTMRGLSLREVRLRHWPRVVIKEVMAGAGNGLAVALTTSGAVYLWSHSLGLALVIGVSMVMSMTIAGLSGAAIPMLLTALRQDPAQSSSIILTTVTDVAGFFSFLGIATLLSGML
jgi:magnesium transporter